VKGFMGLASTGPSASCRIGPPADGDGDGSGYGDGDGDGADAVEAGA
jgi:hypothetical protein